VTDDLRTQVAELLDVPPESLGEQDNLLDHGFDSIRMMSLVEALRARGVEASFMELAEEPTLESWRRLLPAT
jgi:aryl carrier-like protein